MLQHRDGLRLADFAVKQRRAFPLAEFLAATPTAQIANPVRSIGLTYPQIGLATLAVGIALGVETTQILQRWSCSFIFIPPCLAVWRDK